MWARIALGGFNDALGRNDARSWYSPTYGLADIDDGSDGCSRWEPLGFPKMGSDRVTRLKTRDTVPEKDGSGCDR